jgi:hypothetical protein
LSLATRRNCVLALAVVLAMLAAAGAVPASAKPGSSGWHRVHPRKAAAKPTRSSWHLVRRTKRSGRASKHGGSSGRPTAPQPAPTTRYAERVGFASHTSYMDEGEGHALLARASGIGVRWIREDFPWSVIEGRGKGQFDWSVPDRVMRNAARLGINVVAMAGYTPGWANGGRDDKYPPSNPRDYGDFVAAVANRYGKNGAFWSANPELTQRPLAAIELWNEPWLWAFWKPEPDPAAYAALVRAAAPAIKSVHREIKVLICGDLQLGYADSRDYTSGTKRNWEHGFLARLLKHDFASRSVDAYAVHPYSQKFGPYQATISWFADQTFAQQWLYQKLVLTRDMLRAADRFKPLWNTEFGWSTTGDVDEATQAQYLEGALNRAVKEWDSFVERSFIYVLEKPHNGDRDGGYNLFRDDMTPKPAWLAVQRLLAKDS